MTTVPAMGTIASRRAPAPVPLAATSRPGINAERVVMPSDEREPARHRSFSAL